MSQTNLMQLEVKDRAFPNMKCLQPRSMKIPELSFQKPLVKSENVCYLQKNEWNDLFLYISNALWIRARLRKHKSADYSDTDKKI